MTSEPHEVVAEDEPDKVADVKALAREHTAAAINRLKHWLDGDDARVSIAAAAALLDRARGRDEGKIETTITRIAVIRAPMVAKDADAWREQHAPPTNAALPHD
jgi:hypothetical protein